MRYRNSDKQAEKVKAGAALCFACTLPVEQCKGGTEGTCGIPEGSMLGHGFVQETCGFPVVDDPVITWKDYERQRGYSRSSSASR